MREDSNDLLVHVLVLCAGVCIGCAISGGLTDAACSRAAIAHSAAHYDSRTGAFTWNNPVSSTPSGTTP